MSLLLDTSQSNLEGKPCELPDDPGMGAIRAGYNGHIPHGTILLGGHFGTWPWTFAQKVSRIWVVAFDMAAACTSSVLMFVRGTGGGGANVGNPWLVFSREWPSPHPYPGRLILSFEVHPVTHRSYLQGIAYCMNIWLWVKSRYLKWNPVAWNQGLKPAVP